MQLFEQARSGQSSRALRFAQRRPPRFRFNHICLCMDSSSARQISLKRLNGSSPPVVALDRICSAWSTNPAGRFAEYQR